MEGRGRTVRCKGADLADPLPGQARRRRPLGMDKFAFSGDAVGRLPTLDRGGRPRPPARRAHRGPYIVKPLRGLVDRHRGRQDWDTVGPRLPEPCWRLGWGGGAFRRREQRPPDRRDNIRNWSCRRSKRPPGRKAAPSTATPSTSPGRKCRRAGSYPPDPGGDGGADPVFGAPSPRSQASAHRPHRSLERDGGCVNEINTIPGSMAAYLWTDPRRAGLPATWWPSAAAGVFSTTGSDAHRCTTQASPRTGQRSEVDDRAGEGAGDALDGRCAPPPACPAHRRRLLSP